MVRLHPHFMDHKIHRRTTFCCKIKHMFPFPHSMSHLGKVYDVVRTELGWLDNHRAHTVELGSPRTFLSTYSRSLCTDQIAPYTLCLVLYHMVELAGYWAMHAPLTTQPGLQCRHWSFSGNRHPHTTGHSFASGYIVAKGLRSPSAEGCGEETTESNSCSLCPRCLGRRRAGRKPRAGEVALVGHSQLFGHI